MIVTCHFKLQLVAVTVRVVRAVLKLLDFVTKGMKFMSTLLVRIRVLSLVVELVL